MTSLAVLAALLLATGLSVLGGRAVLLRRQQRRRVKRWIEFGGVCPEPPELPPTASHTVTQGLSPRGTIAVHADGLVLSMPAVRSLPMWVPWTRVQAVFPAQDGVGVSVYLTGGLALTVSALAGRALWEAQANGAMRQGYALTAN